MELEKENGSVGQARQRPFFVTIDAKRITVVADPHSGRVAQVTTVCRETMKESRREGKLTLSNIPTVVAKKRRSAMYLQ